MGKLVAWFTGAKNWIIGILAFAVAVLYGLWSNKRAQVEKNEKEAVEATGEAERRANKALLDGLEAEEAAEDEKINPDKRYFH